jgi:gliding motility-associated-like protein
VKIKYIILLVVLFLSQEAFSSHIRAGDISAVRDAVNPYKYTITLTIYYNSARIVPNGGQVSIDNAPIYFGDGTSVGVNYTSPLSNISPITTKAVYITSHTYGGAGSFTISFKESYRIDGIQNITQSGQQDFYLDAQITISPLLGLDALPVLYVPPIDYANVNQIYSHSPGAYDPDGDSLSFDFVAPKVSNGVNAPGYTSPANSMFGGISSSGGASYMQIDPKTGQITWDTPGNLNINTGNPDSETYYNIAIRVTEWRNNRPIGYVIRDMQIIVRNGDNSPPVIQYTQERCIEAGNTLKDSIQITDPDQNMVSMYAYGSPFTFSNPNRALFLAKGNVNPQATSPNPAKAYITWTPACSAVRSQPYTIQFRAEDVVSAEKKLTDVKTEIITVLGPKPVWGTNPLVLEGANLNFIRLNWDSYTNLGCSQSGIQFYIYRVSCDSAYVQDSCVLSTPSNYQFVAKVPASNLTYLDNNNGKGFPKGVRYFYLIQAVFTSGAKGKSQLSYIKGISLLSDAPMPTSVIVETTSERNSSAQNGSIKINWRKPITVGLIAPYTYEIYRSKGFNSNNFGTTPIATYLLTTNLVDSSYSDKTVSYDTLDTYSNAYTYKIIFKDGSGNVTQTSESISSIFLTGTSLDKAAKLTWKTQVPWYVNHYNIYQKKSNELTYTKLPIKVSGLDSLYQVNNLINCDTFNFYIEAVGKYCIDANQDSIISISQEVTVVPISNKPIVPILSVTGGCADVTCNSPKPIPPYVNKLNWSLGSFGSCFELRTFNVYFTPIDNESPLLLNKTPITDTFYVHNQDNGYAGCYEVETILKIDGKEYVSPRSNRVCVDNCFCFDLPNVFTPGNDNANDLYRPMENARFIEKVDFKVYNRWGKLVFKKDDDVNINWDGKDMPEGTYYYTAIVTYQSVYSNNREQTFKGWIQLIK